nr:PilZ domain-containing protein [uncultured Desulfobacter sp.]
MTDTILKNSALLDEIMSEARSLNEDLQKDLLEYIRNIKEPRSYPRVDKAIEIDVLIGDNVIQSNAGNMSASGVLVKSSLKPDVGVPAKVVFALPGQSRPFKLNGVVARTDSGGIGIYFSEMTPYARKHLNDLLKRL